MKRWAIGIGLALLADVALLASGARILVHEKIIPAGEPGTAEGFEGHRADAPSIECRYFTGRSIRSSSKWYSPNGVMGIDECPFLVRPQIT